MTDAERKLANANRRKQREQDRQAQFANAAACRNCLEQIIPILENVMGTLRDGKYSGQGVVTIDQWEWTARTARAFLQVCVDEAKKAMEGAKP